MLLALVHLLKMLTFMIYWEVKNQEALDRPESLAYANEFQVRYMDAKLSIIEVRFHHL